MNPLVGLVIGVSYGLFGVSVGSSILSSFLVLSKFSFSQATATTLLIALIPVTLGGVWVYWKQGVLRLKDSLFIALLIAIGTPIGAIISKRISQQDLQMICGALLIVTGALLVWNALQTLRTCKPSTLTR